MVLVFTAGIKPAVKNGTGGAGCCAPAGADVVPVPGGALGCSSAGAGGVPVAVDTGGKLGGVI